MTHGKAETPMASSVTAILLSGYLCLEAGLAVSHLLRTLTFCSMCGTQGPAKVPGQPLYHDHNPVTPEPEEALLQDGYFIISPHPSRSQKIERPQDRVDEDSGSTGSWP